ncbi:MAG TPA: S8 family serine peptidase, partial [Anaerolineae bacterium]|nr:S8 family serine peptidase [Anaerolineae bacterium]
MKLRKFFNLMFAALFVLSLLPAAALAQDEPATQPVATIESELLDALAKGPADFVIEMAEKADLSKAYDIDDWDARGWFVYNALQETAERTQARAKVYLDEAGLRSESYFAGNEIYVWAGDLQAVNSLAALPEVAVIRQPRTAYVDPVVSDEPVTSEGINAIAWGIDWVEADLFWTNFGIQGEGVIVANIDTGVQWNHPALDQAYKCPANPTDPACWLDPSNSCGGTVCDNNGHGTHTMGTMVGDDGALQIGVAPGARWIACRNMDEGVGTPASYLECFEFFLAPYPVGGTPAQGDP